jgi:ABC-type oligopeptide transport system substrate-binding subunit
MHSMLNDNFAGIRDPQIDAAFERAASTFDRGVRAATYRFVQLRVNQEAYWLPLHALPELDTSDAHVRHFSMNPAAVPWSVPGHTKGPHTDQRSSMDSRQDH